tara:strand:+ start:192 stop:578 length:387 start_codon:yes stop_codon:yes gene_type:complete
MQNSKSGSIKSFGIVFFFVFIIIALYPLLNDHGIRVWSVIVSFIFLFLGVVNSPILKPLNLIWFKFGLFLGKFIAPIVMGTVYFIVVFPTYLLLKLIKKNYLNIRYEKNKTSYWIKIRDKNTTMREQF